jgi:hypothetical protein
LWYRDSRSIKAVLLLGAVSSAASLTRYEGWLLIPFIALAVWLFARRPVHTLFPFQVYLEPVWGPDCSALY